MKFDIITTFPKISDSYFGESILKRAQQDGKIEIKTHDLRMYTADKHKTTDSKPYGGGAGMVLMAEPILKAVEDIKSKVFAKGGSASGGKSPKSKVVVLSAKGKQFNQKIAYDWAKKYGQIIFVSGRYEGIDERVIKILRAEEVSIGPFVLTDGDVAAMAVISAVARLIPGVIKQASLEEESYAVANTKHAVRHKSRRLVGIPTSLPNKIPGASGPLAISQLEYPHYTRPEVLEWKGRKYRVPKVLLSGNHKEINEWRKSQRK